MDERFSKLEIGAPTIHEGLAVFPVLGPDDPATEYSTLDETLASGLFKVTEVSAEGRVPELRVRNSADVAVLLLDGEELVGAKQNRILNMTILVPPRSETTIPVTCVEAGRWRWTRRDFEIADAIAFMHLRSAKARRVTEALAARGQREANQGEVWSMVRERMSDLGVRSATESMRDAYVKYRARTETFRKAIKALPQQRGALFAIGGRIVGMDLFDRASSLAKYLPKLVRACSLDAFGAAATAPSKHEAEAFLRRTQKALSSAKGYSAVGLGRDLRFSRSDIHGAALEVEGHVVHLCAFAGKSGRPV
jgi:hypothetical protein